MVWVALGARNLEMWELMLDLEASSSSPSVLAPKSWLFCVDIWSDASKIHEDPTHRAF